MDKLYNAKGVSDLVLLYANSPAVGSVTTWDKKSHGAHLCVKGISGSARSLLIANLFNNRKRNILFIADNADNARYVYSDMLALVGKPEDVMLFTPSIVQKGKKQVFDGANNLSRTEVLNRLANIPRPCVTITYPEGIMEMVADIKSLKASTITLETGQDVDSEQLAEKLVEAGFARVEFVYEPGQFAIRGGIIDIYSYSNDQPYRIDLFGDTIDSIRIFAVDTQLSTSRCERMEIVPNMGDNQALTLTLMDYIKDDALIVAEDFTYCKNRINQLYDNELVRDEGNHSGERYITGETFTERINTFSTIEFCNRSAFTDYSTLSFNTQPQPAFHKNFEIITETIKHWKQDAYQILILSDSRKQTDRIRAILDSQQEDGHDNSDTSFIPVDGTLHEGFIDNDISLVCLTDHQLFDRYHKVTQKIDKVRQGKALMTLKELNQLQIGDYVVHVDHGIGRFDGLVHTTVNGTQQEMVRLQYRDGDLIFVSIHSLHCISKYKGKDGEPPKINKLGSGAWERLKERTKSKVKDIARDLIQLYAQRKSEHGFAFSHDSYMQHELEASFIYEDTPDQQKTTLAIKHDMESQMPMDRLVCGDVGFGKTEVAIRAAFKAASDSKQVAVLVPTTVLALQHYNSFSERLHDFPVKVEYLSRARSAQQTKQILEELAQGKIDILIGTHKIVGKNVKFKDLGLLIIDEEQKFGVSTKEKLRQMRTNVDTLTLTATPIPRTLQFSLLGARDLSIINTPPPNRYPIQTEIIPNTDEDTIAAAIDFEMSRNGQVFVINNRIQSIYVVEKQIKRLCPKARVAVAHGQMPTEQMEEVLLDFINYDYDVLVATSIIENGVDIPNANTIIINNASRFGLSDLHQMRGRVGRSNRKAYCYLVTPNEDLLSDDARRRLRAIETFAELGSGFNIAMQDLDIRGAGNMLGAEQSGFITDLGYETYQKILNEAVLELKDEEFADLYADQKKENGELYVNDCTIDTDLDVGFPETYIESSAERISLYRELDSLTTEQQLTDYQSRLIDRFGTIPPQGLELIVALRVRWAAMHIGIENVVLKNRRLTLHLISNSNSAYYQSDQFGMLITYATMHPRRCELREKDGRRSMIILNVPDLTTALNVITEISTANQQAKV